MTLISPSRTIQIAGKSYILNASFATLRAVQQRFNRDIVQILVGVMDMPLDFIADLIAIGSGQDADAIGQAILDDTGAMTKEYAVLKTNLIAWLTIAVSPKAEREKSGEMEAILARMNVTFPWDEYQRLALGPLRWQPSEFWRSNVWELSYAWEGYARSKGINLDGDFMTRAELDELKRKFPDK